MEKSKNWPSIVVAVGLAAEGLVHSYDLYEKLEKASGGMNAVMALTLHDALGPLGYVLMLIGIWWWLARDVQSKIVAARALEQSALTETKTTVETIKAKTAEEAAKNSQWKQEIDIELRKTLQSLRQTAREQADNFSVRQKWESERKDEIVKAAVEAIKKEHSA